MHGVHFAYPAKTLVLLPLFIFPQGTTVISGMISFQWRLTVNFVITDLTIKNALVQQLNAVKLNSSSKVDYTVKF